MARALVDHVIAYFGVPTWILGDRGQESVGYIWELLMKWMGCTAVHTSLYNSQGNAKVERSHRTISNLMRATLADVEGNQWPDMVLSVQLTLNAAPREGHHLSPHHNTLLDHSLPASGFPSPPEIPATTTVT